MTTAEKYNALLAEFQSRFNAKLVIELRLPPKHCATNGNRSIHYTVRNSAIAYYRDLAKVACLKATGGQKPLYGAVRLHHVWFMGPSNEDKARKLSGRALNRKGKPKFDLTDSYRPLDDDNAVAALKPAKDGFADAGLVPNDKGKHVKTGDFVRLGTASEHLGYSGILIYVEIIEGAQGK